MSLNVNLNGGSSTGLSNNLELISVMREMTTDIFNKPYLSNGYIDSTNNVVFKQMEAPKGVLNWYAITGGGLFERTAEFENFKRDAIKTAGLKTFSEEKFSKSFPVSFEATAYADVDMNFVSIITSQMAKSARSTLNTLCASVYLNSFVTLGADGIPMLAAQAITGNTHTFGDNLTQAAVLGLANLTQADIQAAIDAMLISKDRSGNLFAGNTPKAILTRPSAFGRINELLDSKTIVGQDNPGVMSYVSSRFGIPVYTMAELSGTVANLPAGTSDVLWIVSDNHSVFNATATALNTWVIPMNMSLNAQETFNGMFHNIVGFYDGFGIQGLVF